MQFICIFRVYDLLRFQKFTIGYAWCAGESLKSTNLFCPKTTHFWNLFCSLEYGCSDDKNVTIFENLKRLSPLHNVKFPSDPKVHEYPAMLLLTGDHDDRVVPSHSYKLVSELQHTIGRNDNQVMNYRILFENRFLWKKYNNRELISYRLMNK